MSIRVDFSNVSSGFEPIPAGKYDVTVFEVEQKVGQSSGKPYLNWQLKIQGGDFDGRRVFYMTSLDPKALWKLKANLNSLGYSKEELESPDFDLDITDLVGRSCTAVVVQEEYQGQTRDKVADLLDAGGGSADSAGASLYR